MKFIKNHKILSMLILIIVIVIICGVTLLMLLLSGWGSNDYGNRLDGIEEVAITDADSKELTTLLGELENVNKVTYHLQGKIVNIFFTVNDVLTLDNAKAYANKILESFSEDQINYYDFQVIFDSENEESATYPIIGYKNKITAEFVWKK